VVLGRVHLLDALELLRGLLLANDALPLPVLDVAHDLLVRLPLLLVLHALLPQLQLQELLLLLPYRLVLLPSLP
jgi:hypothetical protein